MIHFFLRSPVSTHKVNDGDEVKVVKMPSHNFAGYVGTG